MACELTADQMLAALFTDTEREYLVVSLDEARLVSGILVSHLAQNAEAANAAGYPAETHGYEVLLAAEQERFDTYTDLLRKFGVDPDADTGDDEGTRPTHEDDDPGTGGTGIPGGPGETGPRTHTGPARTDPHATADAAPG